MMLTASVILSLLVTAQDAKPAAPAAADSPAALFALMHTSKGDLVIELDHAKAPVTVDNFVAYINDGFYDGTVFHRIVPGFVIQGGGFTKELTQKETKPGISNEWRNGLKNARGTLSMARLGNKPDSATSQFFVNLKDNAALDLPRDGAAYAVFGKVVVGMDVVDEIAKAPTGPAKGMQDVPKEAIVIEKVEVISPEAAKAKIDAASQTGSPAPAADPKTN